MPECTRREQTAGVGIIRRVPDFPTESAVTGSALDKALDGRGAEVFEAFSVAAGLEIQLGVPSQVGPGTVEARVSRNSTQAHGVLVMQLSSYYMAPPETDRRDGGFYQRRMAHENTIHRYDAETATGTPAHIDSHLATDGVAEILSVAMRYRGNGATIEYPDSSMLLVRTDGADRWLVRAMDGTLLIAHNGDAGHRADTTLTGPAEDLYLHLWGRPAPALSVTGDGDAAAAWSAVAP